MTPLEIEQVRELGRQALIAERERCAKIVESFPSRILVLRERPGGPPGNYYRDTTHQDIADAIRRNE